MNSPVNKQPAFSYDSLKRSKKVEDLNAYLKGMNKNTKQRWAFVLGAIALAIGVLAATNKSMQQTSGTRVAPPPVAKVFDTTPKNISAKTDTATQSNADMKEIKQQLVEQAQVSKTLLAQIRTMQTELQTTRAQAAANPAPAAGGGVKPGISDFMIPPPPEPPSTLKKPPQPQAAAAALSSPSASSATVSPPPKQEGQVTLPVTAAAPVAPPEPKRTAARSFIPETSENSEDQLNSDVSVELEPNDKTGFLPAGSFTGATLLSGVEAMTGGTAQSQPQPILIRIDHNAILPNSAGYQIKGCHVLASVWGDMSSERVYGRLATLTCVDQYNKLVLSDEVEGNLVDSDGKNGIRGVLQDRQGAKLARSLLAGFATGMASAFGTAQGTATTALTAAGTTASTMSYPTGEAALRAAGLSGAGEATKKLAEFYLKQAEATMPIIAVDAGRRVSILFTRSKSLKFETTEPFKQKKRTQLKINQSTGG